MRKITRLDDELINSDLKLDGKLLDFLSWAYSDLCDDVNKGIFVEWLVAKILGINTSRSYLWANSDLETDCGIRIEVKASAYWQSWKALNPDGTTKELSKVVFQPDNKIRFSGLVAKDTIDNHSKEFGALKSDYYCFCFHTEKNYDAWNAMDLSKWEFYLVAAMDIKTKSVSLKWLRQNEYGPFHLWNYDIIGYLCNLNEVNECL
jgi:hypothetical protein